MLELEKILVWSISLNNRKEDNRTCPSHLYNYIFQGKFLQGKENRKCSRKLPKCKLFWESKAFDGVWLVVNTIISGERSYPFLQNPYFQHHCFFLLGKSSWLGVTQLWKYILQKNKNSMAIKTDLSISIKEKLWRLESLCLE